MTWMNGIGYHAGQVVRGTPPDDQEMCMAKLVPSQRLRGTLHVISIEKG